MKHLISLSALSADDIREILSLSADLKAKFSRGERPAVLPGRVLSMVFEKPSLRTRNSFEAAMTHLGGSGIFLSSQDAGLHGREALSDVARVLSGYSDLIVLRTFSQTLIEEFAGFSSCPVVNGLSDDRHPCQALTDLFTIQETFGCLDKHVVFIGDGNNIAASLAVAAAKLPIPLTICSPAGYELDSDLIDQLQQHNSAARITQVNDPVAAVKTADVVYTDVWASMGQEAETDRRRKIFAPYQVNAALMAHAPAGCRFMHDLPAHRGEEVTDEVIDGPHSLAFGQAENRMHVAKGLIVWLVQQGKRKKEKGKSAEGGV
jgi:ornithine carbamoyltransferase